MYFVEGVSHSTQPTTKERNDMWNTNNSPVFMWRNEKQSRQVRGFKVRDFANPTLGFCQTRQDARRALDANLRADALTWDTTPGSSASRAAEAAGEVSYSDLFDFSSDLSDAQVLGLDVDGPTSREVDDARRALLSL
tara:strand:+ start:142 stop:552 length:411 start_codon:yes stop_codon:yes gene_type:complete